MVTPDCEIIIGPPRQLLELEPLPEPLPHRREHFDRFSRNFFADPVTGNNRYSHEAA